MHFFALLFCFEIEDASPHPTLDLPLCIAVICSVGLIIIIGPLTIVVCILDASTGVKCGPSPQDWSAVYPFAGLQVCKSTDLHFTPGLGMICVI